jgi:hypothetical protein
MVRAGSKPAPRRTRRGASVRAFPRRSWEREVYKRFDQRVSDTGANAGGIGFRGGGIMKGLKRTCIPGVARRVFRWHSGSSIGTFIIGPLIIGKGPAGMAFMPRRKRFNGCCFRSLSLHWRCSRSHRGRFDAWRQQVGNLLHGRKHGGTEVPPTVCQIFLKVIRLCLPRACR